MLHEGVDLRSRAAGGDERDERSCQRQAPDKFRGEAGEDQGAEAPELRGVDAPVSQPVRRHAGKRKEQNRNR